MIYDFTNCSVLFQTKGAARRSSGVGSVLEAGRDGVGVSQSQASLHSITGVIATNFVILGIQDSHSVKHDVLTNKIAISSRGQ